MRSPFSGLRRPLSRLRRWADVYGRYLLGDGAAPLPLTHVSLDMTYRCNHRCNMCFLYGDHLREHNPVLETMRRRSELSLPQWLRVLEDIRSTGTRSLVVTGGEALLKEGLLAILARAKALGFSVSLLSNGSRVSEETALELVSIGVDFLRFSLDGGREAHDAICGVPSHDNLLSAVRRIARAKASRSSASPRLGFEMVLQRRNQDQVCRVVETALQEGVGHLTVSNVYFAPPAAGECEDGAGMRTRDLQGRLYAVDAAALASELARARELARRGGLDLRCAMQGEDDIRRIYHEPRFSYVDKCLYPWLMCRINPYGDVIPCTGSSRSMGSVLERPLAEIWNAAEYRRFRLELKSAGLFDDCIKCNTLASDSAKRWRWLPRGRGGFPA